METNFADMVAAILKAYDYTEAELAKRLDCSQPTIHRLKKGSVTSPSYQLGVQITALYQARPDDRAEARTAEAS